MQREYIRDIYCRHFLWNPRLHFPRGEAIGWVRCKPTTSLSFLLSLFPSFFSKLIPVCVHVIMWFPNLCALNFVNCFVSSVVCCIHPADNQGKAVHLLSGLLVVRCTLLRDDYWAGKQKPHLLFSCVRTHANGVTMLCTWKSYLYYILL